MENKSSKLLLVFLGRFVLIFGVLILPWPGLNQMYGEYFRAIGQFAFSRDTGSRVVQFAPNDKQAKAPTLTTKLTLANRDLLDATGKGLVKRTEFDTRSIGWVPTALTVALIVATPIPWSRRATALAGGLLLSQLYVLFTIQTWIWNSEPAVHLTTLSPMGIRAADALEFTFVEQLGASFAVPVLIWILVSFRRCDAALWNGLMNPFASASRKKDGGRPQGSQSTSALRRPNNIINMAPATMNERYRPAGSGVARLPVER